MRKGILAVILIISAVFCVFGQNSGTIDLILLLDTSSAMGSSYEKVNDYITGAFLSEFLRTGDTFHLITFSESPRLDIARRISARGDIETIIGRMLIQYPVETGNDAKAAVNYVESYIATLPPRSKKIVMVSIGGSDTNNVVGAAKQRLSSKNATLDFVSVTGGQSLVNLPNSGRPSPPRQTTASGTTSTGTTPAGTGTAVSGTQGSSKTGAQSATQGTTAQGASQTGTQATTQGTTAQGASQTGTQSTAQGTTGQGASQTGAQSTAQVTTAQGSSQTGAQSTTQPSASAKEPSAASTDTASKGSSAQGESSSGGGKQASEQNRDSPKKQDTAAKGSSNAASAGAAEKKEGGSFNPTLLLIIGIIAALLLLILLIVFFSRRLGSSPNRVMASVSALGNKKEDRFTDHSKDLANYAARQSKKRVTPYSDMPVKEQAVKQPEINPAGPLLLNLFVEDQNTSIGKRNIHSLKSGYSLSVGGSKADDFLIFLVPMPSHLGEIRRSGSQLTFIPRKPRYFPDIGSNEVRDCINKKIRVVSDKNYEMWFSFVMYEDPLIALNRVLHSIKVPG